jgi:hypothetical protein
LKFFPHRSNQGHSRDGNNMPKMRITRRAVLGSVGASLSATLAAPARASLSNSGDPGLPQARRAFAARLEVARTEQTSGARVQHWANILGGAIDGPRLNGVVQGGRVDWCTDLAGESVEVTTTFIVRCEDGRMIEVRDRGFYPVSGAATASAAICTAPELVEPAGQAPVAPAVLVGRLDASGLGQGVVRLVAFEVS